MVDASSLLAHGSALRIASTGPAASPEALDTIAAVADRLLAGSPSSPATRSWFLAIALVERAILETRSVAADWQHTHQSLLESALHALESGPKE